MLVLLPVAIWGVWYFMWFVFCLASLATNVQILMMCWNVAVKVHRII